MEDDHLERRLDAARRVVAEQRDALRTSRRRRREVEAAASERSDRAVARALHARGAEFPDPPVPSRPPDWPEHEPPRADGQDEDAHE